MWYFFNYTPSFEKKQLFSGKSLYILSAGLYFGEEFIANCVHNFFLPDIVGAEVAATLRVNIFGNRQAVKHVDEAVTRIWVQKKSGQQSERRAGMTDEIYHVPSIE